MSTLRVSNIEAKADPSSPTINEKVKITNSNGDVMLQLDGATPGITTVGINTTTAAFTVDANQNIEFVGSVKSSGVSTFTSGLRVTGGLVGIGSDNPQAPLNVLNNNANTPTVWIRNISGGGDSPALRVQGGANNNNAVGTFEVRDYDGNVDFKVGGTGFVGIGTDNVTLPFEVWTGAASTSFAVDGSGRVTMPYQPHAEGGVTGIGNSDITTGGHVLIYNNPSINVGNHYDATNYRFNCPVSGNYLVKAHAQSSGQAATQSNTANFNIRRNGTSVSGVYESRYYGGAAPAYVKLEITDVVYANAGDYLDIYLIQSNSGVFLEYNASDIRWRFSYTLLG